MSDFRISRFTCLALLLAFACCSSKASGGIISGVIAPDITANYIHADYDYDSTIDSGLLALDGVAVSLENPTGVLTQIWMGSDTAFPDYPGGIFSLDANFNGSGSFLSGDFEIKGTLVQSEAQVTLLKGTLVEAEGAFLDQGLLEFRADNGSLDGTLASLFLPNDVFGIRVSKLGSGFSFANSFSYNPAWSGAVADIGRAVPEPGTAIMFASFLGIGVCRRRRRR